MGSQGGGSGCGTLIAALVGIALVVAAVVGAVISVAALVDPFSWLPPIGEIFGDCTDEPETAWDDCALATRYPGFWGHVIINFVYALVALGLVVAFARVLPGFRKARSARFESDAAVKRYREARQTLTLVATLLAGVAALPLIAALG